jgi:formylglycine-generating enzyme required for sulfatase activity
VPQRDGKLTQDWKEQSMKNLILAVVVIFLGATATGAWAEPPAAQPAKELALDLGNGASMKLALIPAGKFTMGSPDEEKKAAVKEAVAAGIPEAKATDAFKDEVQHEVTISKPFYMGVTHVTVDQFAAFVKDSGYKTDAEKDGWAVGFEIKDGKFDFKKVDGCSWRNPSFDQKGDYPVVQVSWNDAQAFCDWLSKKSGKTVVLPTEAQWEYACRAGTTTAYPWGDNPDDGKGWANCADQSLKTKLPNPPANWTFFSWDDGFVFTSPVASFKPNAFGLYDMIGNAWEWCSDRYGDYDKGAVTDPTGAETGGLRVLRGGSWYGIPRYCRSAYRSRDDPDGRSGDGGFRVAVVAVGVDLH